MFARRRFSATGFALALILVLVASAVLLLLQSVAVTRGERQPLEPSDILGPTGVILAIALWQGYRHSHGFGMAALRFRKRWRKRQWLEIFGFGGSLTIFGVVLGLAISIPSWLPPTAADAADATLVNVALGALAGFVGGFGSQFTPLRRRTSR